MRRLPSITMIATLLMTTAAWACPMCKESVPSSDAQSSVGVPSGFNNSIYLMLVGLFCVMGFVAFTVIKGVRSSNISARPGFPVTSKRN